MDEKRHFTSMAFSAYERSLDMVIYFQYLGRVILTADRDWETVIRNLYREMMVWKKMTRILSREGTEPRVSEFF